MQMIPLKMYCQSFQCVPLIVNDHLYHYALFCSSKQTLLVTVEEWKHYIHKSVSAPDLATIPMVYLSDCHDSCTYNNQSCRSYSYCSQRKQGQCHLHDLAVNSTDQLTDTTLCDSFIRIPLDSPGELHVIGKGRIQVSL